MQVEAWCPQDTVRVGGGRGFSGYPDALLPLRSKSINNNPVKPTGLEWVEVAFRAEEF